MKKLIFSSLLLTGLAANANIVTKAGSFDGTVTGGHIKGKCNPSSSTCWKFDTEARTLTIYLNVINVFHNATPPVLQPDGTWESTYVE